MSVIFCDSCDHLVDTDYFPEFEWDEKTDKFTCEFCLESREEPDHEDDGDALASAGYGTDEDYGYFGEDSQL